MFHLGCYDYRKVKKGLSHVDCFEGRNKVIVQFWLPWLPEELSRGEAVWSVSKGEIRPLLKLGCHGYQTDVRTATCRIFRE